MRRAPKQICLSEIICLSGGLLAPFGDAEELRSLIHQDVARLLYQVFLDVRNAAARSFDNVTLADIVSGEDSPRLKRKRLGNEKGRPHEPVPDGGGRSFSPQGIRNELEKAVRPARNGARVARAFEHGRDARLPMAGQGTRLYTSTLV